MPICLANIVDKLSSCNDREKCALSVGFSHSVIAKVDAPCNRVMMQIQKTLGDERQCEVHMPLQTATKKDRVNRARPRFLIGMR